MLFVESCDTLVLHTNKGKNMKVSDLINNSNLNKGGDFFQPNAMFHGQDSARVARGLAELKGKIAKGKGTSNDLNLWLSIPAISADVQDYAVIKDYSISRDGHAGVVVDVRDMRKRNGKTVTVVEFFFFAHTNLKDMRTRKIQFDKKE